MESVQDYINALPRKTFNNIVHIGGGAFSEVFRAIHNPTQTEVAIKAFHNISENVKDIQKEISLHETLHHPFIADCFGHFDTHKHTFLVMEFVEGQTLLEKINMSNGIPEVEAQQIFVELCTAMKYLHQDRGITHRDLKLENILVDVFGNIRLIDFGFGSQANNLMQTHCGSVPYCAPELFTTECYTNAVDIWSMGVILYSMIAGHLPFDAESMNMIVNQIKTARLPYDPKISDSCFDLLYKMLMKNPSCRISLNEILDHPFVTNAKIAPALLLGGFEQRFPKTSKFQSTSERIKQRKNFPELLDRTIIMAQIDHQRPKQKIRSSSAYVITPITGIRENASKDALQFSQNHTSSSRRTKASVIKTMFDTNPRTKSRPAFPPASPVKIIQTI